METYGRWRIIREIGRGGQGVVYLAHDTQKFDAIQIKSEIPRALHNVSPTAASVSEQAERAGRLADLILRYGQSENPEYIGALKVLHTADRETDYQKQLDRMKREVKGLRSASHPNIVPILDEKLEDRWFVMKFFPQGPLSKNLGRFKGDMLAALQAFRPLVEALTTLHAQNLVHRDIKPENVFFGENDQLVLGDFGLVHFIDDEGTRLTETFENVGSRDWMPPWAMGMRLENVKPTFDVFSLGKLFWSMLSGKPRLQLWYHHKPQFELEHMFSNQDIRWGRLILDRCVLEEEQGCLSSAADLLEIVDWVLNAVRRHCQVVKEGVVRLCRVCGLGSYKYVVNENNTDARNFGVTPTGTSKFKIFSCNYCGHVEFFYLPDGKPRAWE